MKQAKVLDQSELKRLLRVVSTTKHDKRNRVVVLLSYLAGLRACEIAALRVSDVVDKVDGKPEIKGEIRLASSQTKGSQAQTIIFSQKLRKEIENYVSSHSNTADLSLPLIRSQKGQGFSSQTIQNLFRVLYETAGISNASSHSGRRTFITNLSEKGVSTKVIQELARHSSMATTQQYIDVSTDKLQNAVDLIGI